MKILNKMQDLQGCSGLLESGMAWFFLRWTLHRIDNLLQSSPGEKRFTEIVHGSAVLGTTNVSNIWISIIKLEWTAVKFSFKVMSWKKGLPNLPFSIYTFDFLYTFEGFNWW